MEKIRIKFSMARFTSSLHAVTEEGMKPDLVWRLLLGCASIIAVAIGVFGYIMYVWAENVQTPTVSLKEDNGGLSLGELESALASYVEKEANLTMLKVSPPVAPPHRLGEGKEVAPPVSTPETQVSGEAASSAGVMPQ